MGEVRKNGKNRKARARQQRKCTKEGAFPQDLDNGMPSAKMHDVAMTDSYLGRQ